jgi:hypothetical protein
MKIFDSNQKLVGDIVLSAVKPVEKVEKSVTQLKLQAQAWEEVFDLCMKLGMDVMKTNFSGTEDVCSFIKEHFAPHPVPPERVTQAVDQLVDKPMAKEPAHNECVYPYCPWENCPMKVKADRSNYQTVAPAPAPAPTKPVLQLTLQATAWEEVFDLCESLGMDVTKTDCSGPQDVCAFIRTLAQRAGESLEIATEQHAIIFNMMTVYGFNPATETLYRKNDKRLKEIASVTTRADTQDK